MVVLLVFFHFQRCIDLIHAAMNMSKVSDHDIQYMAIWLRRMEYELLSRLRHDLLLAYSVHNTLLMMQPNRLKRSNSFFESASDSSRLRIRFYHPLMSDRLVIAMYCFHSHAHCTYCAFVSFGRKFKNHHRISYAPSYCDLCSSFSFVHKMKTDNS